MVWISIWLSCFWPRCLCAAHKYQTTPYNQDCQFQNRLVLLVNSFSHYISSLPRWILDSSGKHGKMWRTFCHKNCCFQFAYFTMTSEIAWIIAFCWDLSSYHAEKNDTNLKKVFFVCFLRLRLESSVLLAPQPAIFSNKFWLNFSL